MRVQPFFEILRNNLTLDTAKTRLFMSDPDFRGGWEVWLQCNIGYAFMTTYPNSEMEREVAYASGVGAAPYLSYNAATGIVATTANANAAARADFVVRRRQGIADETHLELKCLSAQEGINAAWTRFFSDMNKVTALTKVNGMLSCIAMLATHGVFRQQDVNNLHEISEGRHNSFALDYADPAHPVLTPFNQVALNGDPRTFLIGTAFE